MTIEILGLTKSFDGKKVIDNLDFSISDDDRWVITGEGGSGKTLLLRLISGLEKPDSGSINLLGDYKHDNFTVGMVFQNDRLFEDFTACENVAAVHPMHSERIAKEELEKLIPQEKTNIPVSTLSASERRMVAIVRACMFPSNILLLDEPFRGMSEDERKKALDFIYESAGHKSIIFVQRTAEGLEGLRNLELGI